MKIKTFKNVIRTLTFGDLHMKAKSPEKRRERMEVKEGNVKFVKKKELLDLVRD